MLSQPLLLMGTLPEGWQPTAEAIVCNLCHLRFSPVLWRCVEQCGGRVGGSGLRTGASTGVQWAQGVASPMVVEARPPIHPHSRTEGQVGSSCTAIWSAQTAVPCKVRVRVTELGVHHWLDFGAWGEGCACKTPPPPPPPLEPCGP